MSANFSPADCYEPAPDRNWAPPLAEFGMRPSIIDYDPPRPE
jgi:hypothetical protein